MSIDSDLKLGSSGLGPILVGLLLLAITMVLSHLYIQNDEIL